MESSSKVRLNLAEISRITSHSLGAPSIAAEELTDGWLNTICKATLGFLGQVVLKMAPPPAYLVMRYERHLLESEVGVLRLLARGGVPVPKVLAYDSSAVVHQQHHRECIRPLP